MFVVVINSYNIKFIAACCYSNYKSIQFIQVPHKLDQGLQIIQWKVNAARHFYQYCFYIHDDIMTAVLYRLYVTEIAYCMPLLDHDNVSTSVHSYIGSHIYWE